MAATLSPAIDYLERDDAAAVVELATLLSPAVLVEPELVRAVRLSVVPRLGVAAEADLWFSPLARDRSAAGFTFVPDVVQPLQERLRNRLAGAADGDVVWRVGEILDRVHTSSPPLIRLEERITWLALSRGDAARAEIDRELERAVRAVEAGRAGVARWAARELPLMPVEIHRTGAAHRLGRVARPHVAHPIRLGAELAEVLDAVAVAIDVSDVLADLPVKREGERLLLGAFEAEQALGIQVPDTDPRLLHVTSDTLDETVSVPADGVADLRVGRGEVRIRTAAGAVYELQPPVEEPRPRAATHRRLMADVVIVIPDFGGSVLARDGKDVWNISGGVLPALESLGRVGRELVLEDDPVDVDEADGITAPRVVDELTLVPGLWRIDGYGALRRHLHEQFDIRVGENVFEFPYDWRRDHRVAARRLARVSAEWLSSWRANSGASDARLVLVAHGAGGLVAQYFVEMLEGWRDTRLLVSLGTPFGGTLVALRQLVEGLGRVAGFNLTDAVRSWTSVYQMLTTYPCVELEDGEARRVSEVRLPGVDPRRAGEALAFHRELRAALEQNQADAAYTASGYRLAPVVGIEQPTLQSAALRGGAVVFLRRLRDDDLGGDSVVPRPSAIPAAFTDLSYALYVSERHASLPRNSDVLLYVGNLLTGGPGPGVYRSARQAASFGLDLADAFLPGDPIEFRVFASVAEKPMGIIEDVTSGERHRIELRREEEEGAFAASAPPLPPGTYRLVVVDPGVGGSVADIFIVTPDLKGEPVPP